MASAVATTGRRHQVMREDLGRVVDWRSAPPMRLSPASPAPGNRGCSHLAAISAAHLP